MSIAVIVNGAFGKMGVLACQALEKDARFQLVGSVGRADDLAKTIRDTKAAVVVDLTRADVVYDHAKTIIEAGAHPVIGTSGLTKEQIQILSSQCETKGLGGLIVPNFSVAVLLMMQFSKMAAKLMPAVEIVEIHHPEKFDAPSGTAIKTAAMIAEARGSKHTIASSPSRGELHEGVPIHALRLPGLLAKQYVMFGGEGEMLTILHESMDRQCFMPGLLLACERVMGLKSLKYGLEQVIEGLGA